MQCSPHKWIVYAPLALLPFLAAMLIGTRDVVRDLRERVTGALAASGASWAKTDFDGRDVILTGDSPSAEAMASAADAVAASYGVRRLELRARIVETSPAATIKPAPQAAVTVKNESAAIKRMKAEGVAAVKSSVTGRIDIAPAPAPAAVNPPLGPSKIVAAQSPPQPVMQAPTVTRASVMVARPIITGSWSSLAARKLTVSLAGANYVLGTDKSLTSVSGSWSLALPRPLPDGAYDIAVETADVSGRTLRDSSRDEILVDAAPPAAPTVGLYAGLRSPDKISGTWDSAAAARLQVSIPDAGIAATLRTDKTLTSLSGVWTLSLPRPLRPGSYDVAVVTGDSHGRIAADQTKFEILVKQTPPPPPPPYDCAAVLARIGSVFPIRFGFDLFDVDSPYDLSVNQIAALLKDERCREATAEVTGYADYLGATLYNQALSEKRAQMVVNMLGAAGVAPLRLNVRGMSSADPVDNARSEVARARNRRVVIRIVP